jgi:beta-glucanase (GH16 family)
MAAMAFALAALPGYAQFSRLVWADEFNKNGLPDTTKWSYDLGGSGWGNNELQYYTNSIRNASVQNGVLHVKALKDSLGKNGYTSARLVSKLKGDWTYGRIEVRARLPKGTGIWPAIWMLPTQWKYGNWPASGEIDIMEFVGYQPDSLFGSVHTRRFNHSIGTQKTKSLYSKDLPDAFHVYAINWTAEAIAFLFDGKEYFRFTNDHSGKDAWPFDTDFHLLLNVAVGGGWGGKKGVDNTIFPQEMLVDYVRVYQ